MISLILSPSCIYIDSQDLAALKVQLRRVKQIKLFLLQTVREMPTYDMQVQHDKEYSKANVYIERTISFESILYYSEYLLHVSFRRKHA